MAYGTVMIARLADGASVDDWLAGIAEWKEARKVSGFSGEYTLLADDGRLVSCVIFDSKEQYQTLADDPEQDAWWTSKVRPLLSSEPEWIDGTWA